LAFLAFHVGRTLFVVKMLLVIAFMCFCVRATVSSSSIWSQIPMFCFLVLFNVGFDHFVNIRSYSSFFDGFNQHWLLAINE